jgi:hypothetical protein
MLIGLQNNSRARLLAYVTGLVNQRLHLRCEYPAAENRVLRTHLSAKVRRSDTERRTLAEIGKRLGRNLLSDVACVPSPRRFSAGAVAGSPVSSVDPNIVPTQGGRASNSRSKR